ncbi:MAG TPA: proprotein convertase P-domain-containing protein [Kofleriaceae bacterium]|nr:proprotein convertase P-domain-containing protein [Kofleriaceae bacterium]
MVTALATTTSATADELESALGEKLFEASHSVDVTVSDGIAIYKVRRVFANPGKVADEARLEIDLPYGAAATGLRIRARSQWFDGELMEAEKAAALYQELTGKGVWKPKDPALLYWRWADKLAMQVFPVLPGSTSTVEYTLTVPTRYSGGRVFLSYPRQSAEVAPNLATPVLRVRPAWADATTMMKVDGIRSATDAPIVLAPPVMPEWLEAIPHEDSASYVASTIEVKDTAATRAIFTTAKLTIDIEHTYKSDLRVALYTPANVRIDVFDGNGGGDNDVRGAFDLALPSKTKGAGVWRLVVSDQAALDAGSLERWTLQLGDGKVVKLAAADTPVFIPDAPESASDGGVAMIELAPPAIDVVTTRLGKVVASPAHAFGRLEVDTAPQLRPLPKAAQVVFAVDASHSMGPDGIAMQLKVVRAYLSHVPDAQVEIVLYRRQATRLFGTFVPATEIEARLKAATDAGKLVPGNGSALDEGVRLATAALGGRKGPLRVVVTTDDLLRGRWENKDALTAFAGLPAAAIVHVVETDPRGGGDLSLSRDDEHALSEIALAHHGIFATLSGGTDLGKELPGLVLGLVRPMRLDHFVIKGFDLEKGKYDQTLPETLDEGTGLRMVVAHTTAPARVELSGMIWGDKFKRVATVDAGFSLAAAGWVFSEDDHGELSHDEMMKVAMMGKAVSPVTSYLAVEPGTRPSTIGFEEGSGRGGMRGYRSAVPSVRMGSASSRKKPDPASLLGDAIKTCVATHKPAAGWTVTLAMESTYDEVVDVQPKAGDKALAACLVEAVWALRLPGSVYNMSRERFTFELR